MANLKEYLFEMRQSGVIWKSKKLWAGADSPEAKQIAMREIAEMLTAMEGDTLREAYAKEIQDEVRIKQRDILREIKTLTSNKKREKEEKQARAVANEETPWELGLPEDFTGEIYLVKKFLIFEYKNETYKYTPSSDGGGKYHKICNFVANIFYHVETGTESAYKLVEIRNVLNESSIVNVNTDDFVTAANFQKVVARKGNYIIFGNAADFNYFQSYLQRNQTTASNINALGYQKRGNFWAWANGITPIPKKAGEHPEFINVDGNGIVQYNNRKYYLPACSDLYSAKDGMYKDERRFIYTDPIKGFGFKEWAELFTKVHGNNGKISMLFFISALFSDFIFKEMGSRFPILDLFGPGGTGKGGIIDSIGAMFGEKQDSIMLEGESTPKGFMRKMGQFINGIVVLDEYKNTLVKHVGSLKNLYDRTGYTRAQKTNGTETETTQIYSVPILSGQEMPTFDNALFMRTIMLPFSKGFTAEQTFNKPILDKNYEALGLSYITAEIIQLRSVITDNFRNVYAEKISQLRKVLNPLMDERYKGNYAMLLAVMDIMSKYLVFPFSYEDFYQLIIDTVENQYTVGSGNTDLSNFFDVIENLFQRKEIKEDDDFVLDGRQGGLLYLSLTRIHPLYQKEMRLRGEMSLPKSTLESYLRNDRNIYVEHKRKRFPSGENCHCHVLKYNRLKINLIGSLEADPKLRAEQIIEKEKKMGIVQPLGEDEIPFDAEQQPFK